MEIEKHVGDIVQVQSNDQFGVIGELSFRNEYDGHTIDRMLDRTDRIMGRRPKLIASDRGYRGRKQSVLGIPYWIRFNSYRSKDFADSTKSSMFSFIIL